MKTLYIVRHAKAVLKSSDKNDVKRPLMLKGEINTKFVTNYLLAHNIKVDLIISSHAVRSLQTAKLYAAAFRYPEESIRVDTQLYYSGIEAIFNQFYDIPDHVKSVLIVGHNPYITKFANYFIEDKIENLPTSGLIAIDFLINKWQKITKAERKENLRLFPKIIKKSIKYACLKI